jgi:hypothetical protein
MARTTIAAGELRTLHLLAAHASANAPHQARFHNAGADLEAMFPAPVGHVNRRDDYRSALSPGAYLADLLHLAGEHITAPADQRRSLRSRRPDIFAMELTRAKAEVELPYLEVANGAMRAYVEQTIKREPSALEQLAQSHFPFGLPFHRPLAEIRAYLSHFQIDLADLYAAFRPPADDPGWVAETLGLAPGELEYLTTPRTTAADLSAAYGVTVESDTALGGLDVAATFLAQSGISPAELLVLTKLAVPDAALALQATDPGDGGPPVQMIANLTLKTLDYLNRFIRLARRLDWSFDDLSWALAVLKATLVKSAAENRADLAGLALIQHVQRTYKLPIDVVCSFAAELRATAPLGQPHAKSLFERVFAATLFAPADGAQPAGGDALPSSAPALGAPLYTVGMARRGSRRSINLASTAAKADDAYRGMQIAIISGAGANQARTVAAYRGGTRLATVDRAWDTAPGRTSKYLVSPAGSRTDLRAALFGALNVSDADGQALLDHLLGQNGSLTLDRPTLTRLYRLQKLARVVGLAVPEYLALLRMIARQPKTGAPVYPSLARAEVESIVDFLTVTAWAEWLAANRLSVAQLEHLAGTSAGTAVRAAGQAVAPDAVTAALDSYGRSAQTMPADPNAAARAAAAFWGAFFGVDAALAATALAFLTGAQNQQTPPVLTPADLTRLSLMLELAGALALTAPQLRAVLAHAAPLGVPAPAALERFDLDTLRRIADVRQLAQSFAGRADAAQDAPDGDAPAQSITALLRYLQHDTGISLAALSGWEAEQIAALAGRIGAREPYSLSQLTTMQSCFTLAGRLGVHVQLLIELAALPAVAEQAAPASWPMYRKAARALLSVVRSRYSPEDWSTTFEPLRDHLNELERDALADYLIRQLQGTFPDIATRQDLYEFLLVDVEMEGCARTTYVREAIDCLQIYIQRCRMNLEAGVTLSAAIPDQLWDWMGHYRLWQANRRLFLYPENYLDPTLRTVGATPEFAALQRALLQADPTNDLAEQLAIDYLESLDQLAQLEIIAGCYAPAHSPVDGQPPDGLFVLGRTATDPPTYFVRRATLDSGGRAGPRIAGWSAWQKIDVNIPADQATLLYAGDRLTILWVEQRTYTDRGDDSRRQPPVTLVTVKFSHRQVSGKWLHPQTLVKDVNLAGLPQSYRFGATAQEIYLSQQPGVPRAALSMLPPDWRATLESLARTLFPAFERVIGGIMRPGDDGTAWTKVSGIAEQIMRLYAFGDHLLATTPTAMMYSPDKGTTWATAAGIGGGTSAVVAFGSRLFANHNIGGLFASVDNGATWAPVGGAESARTLVVAGDRLFAGTMTATGPPGSTSRIAILTFGNLLSLDGVTWWPVTGPTAMISAIVANGAQFFAFTNSGLFTNGDNGAAWTPTASPAGNLRGIAVSGGRLSVGTSNGIFTSVNNGASWDQAAGLTGGVNAIVAIDGRMYAAGNDGVFTSANNGASWSQGAGLAGPVSAVVAFGARLFAAAEAGLFTSADSGATWSPAEGAQGAFRNVVALDDRLFAAGSDGLYQISAAGALFQTGAVLPLVAAGGDAWVALPQPQPGGAPTYRSERLTTGAVGQLHQIVAQSGLDALLTPETQALADAQPFPLTSPYSLYFREIFFHIPFLIGRAMQNHQRFAEARSWYEYIFDPLAPAAGAAADRFWRYLPFRGQGVQQLSDALAQQLTASEGDPFDPFVIADLRSVAYQKALAMQYIDNLVAWGDALYAQDGWENLNAATTLYVLAAELLGAAPQSPPAAEDAAVLLADAGKAHHAPLPSLQAILPTARQAALPGLGIPAFFFLPENDVFAGYWGTVQRRLYQIRHCMNLQGVVRRLATYDAPIDPRQLMRAVAAGRALATAGPPAPVDIPHYRFTYLLERARQVTSELRGLGGELLSALEKQDAEQLAALRTTHEGAILALTTLIKQKQQEEAAGTLASLQQSLAAAQARSEQYRSWATQYLSPGEMAGLLLAQEASALKKGASIITMLSGIAYAIPNIYGLADGGSNYGKIVEIGSDALQFEASILEWAGDMALNKAHYDRRQADWQLLADQAGVEVRQINAQISAQSARQDALDQEMAIHQQTISQNQEVDQYYRQKFTSRELYQWMVGQLGGLYFQTYQLALDLARMAERAFQYERNTTNSYVNAGGWDGLRQGLLADESLALGLSQMEKAYIEQDERQLEIEKTISLGQINPQALVDLRRDGRCGFQLSEALFDLDFPGHYLRKIKSISLAIPAVVGPYQNIHATLTQLSNTIVLTPDQKTVTALLDGPQDRQSDGPTLRIDWRANQQVALSRGAGDAGLFELNFHDERYLPFEGTGAVSQWELRMPKASNRFAFDSISDVIITLHYTARDGGDGFRKQLLDPQGGARALRTVRGYRLFTARQLNAAGWQALRTGAQQGLDLQVDAGLFPPNLGAPAADSPEDAAGGQPRTIALYAWPAGGGSLPAAGGAAPALRLPSAGQAKRPASALSDTQGWEFAPPASAPLVGTWQLSFESAAAARQALEGVEDLLLIVPFEGTLRWEGWLAGA